MTIVPRTITVAAAQLPARPLEEARQALDDIERAVQQARQAAAHLIVLSECCYPCYWLGDRRRYFQADILRGPAIEAFFADLARKHHIHIVAGLIYEHNDSLHDAAVLFDPAGQVLGRHFKTFLWDREHDWYEPGNQVQPVETDLGRVGMLVCAEGRSPEVFASHAAQQAGLLAMPTAWVNAADKPGDYYNPQPDFLVRARAVEFSLPMVCANKFGQECDEARFCGMSLIVAPNGQTLAKAPADQPAVLTAAIEVRPCPPVLVDATVRRLLETGSVVPPGDASPIRTALLPARLLTESRDPADTARFFQVLANRGVRVAITCTEPNERMTAARQATAAAVQLITAREAGGNVSAGKATFGCLTARQVESFAPARLLALDGAQALCIFGPWKDIATLRVRAVENRVFVLAVSQEECVAITPTGRILAQLAAGQAEPLVIDLDLAEAANKLVAPQTDVWTERRVEAYHLSG